MPTPPNPTTGDLLKFTARARLNAQLGQISCHMVCSGTVGAGLTIRDIANGWGSGAVDTAFINTLANDATVYDCQVELIDTTSKRVTQSAFGLSAYPAGVAGITACPTQVAAVVTKQTGFAGPRFRGRVYFPFIPVAFLNSPGSISDAARGVLEATAQALWNPFTLTVGAVAASFSPVLVHHPAPSDPVPMDWDSINFWQASTLLGTQKRRGDWGKLNTMAV